MPFTISMLTDHGVSIDLTGRGTHARNVDLFENLLNADEIRRASKALKASRVGARLKKKIEAYAGLEIARNFKDGKDSQGSKWEPLAEGTIRNKTKINPNQTRIQGTFEKFSKRTGEFETLNNTRKRLDDSIFKTNIQTQFKSTGGSSLFVPLVETGELFSSVTQQTTRKLEAYGTTQMKTKGTSGIRLVTSASSNVVSFLPTSKGKGNKWFAKFGVHNAPSRHRTETKPGVMIPGREFFYLSEQAQLFTLLLVKLASMFGKKFTEKSMPFESRTRTDEGGERSFTPRTKSRESPSMTGQPFGGYRTPQSTAHQGEAMGTGGYREQAGFAARGRRLVGGLGGKIDFTLNDYHNFLSSGSGKLASQLKGRKGKIRRDEGLTIEQWFDDKTNRLLEDTDLLVFLKATSAVSAARAVKNKNRKGRNTKLKRLVR